MNRINTFLNRHHIWSAIILSIVGFVLIAVFSGIASSITGKEFTDLTSLLYGHLLTCLCIVFLIWKLGWLKSAGVAQIGTYRVWVIAIAGIIYFAAASLYSFFGTVSFDIKNLVNWSVSNKIILTNLLVSINEEILFRGVILYVLVRIWGNSKKGQFGSVLLMSAMFAMLHLPPIFFSQVSILTVLLFFFESVIISFWWGAIVLSGGSIWPAIMFHFIGNVVVALQGHSSSMIEPVMRVYVQFFLFSIPLGIIAIWMLLKTSVQINVTKSSIS